MISRMRLLPSPANRTPDAAQVAPGARASGRRAPFPWRGLGALAPGAGHGAATAGDAVDPDLTGATEDSREARPGWLFCAFTGASSDGREFIGAAAEKGAPAVIAAYPAPESPVPAILVPGEKLRAAASEASRLAFGEPDAGLFRLGVTGTNGKSTVCALAEALLKANGFRPGVIGTTGFRFPGGEVREAPNTTPEGPLLWKTLRDMKDGGADAVAMEASSHALELGRLGTLAFNCAMFLNLSRDHLDFHGDMESYFKAKCRLFLGPDGTLEAGPGEGGVPLGVVNADDPYGRRLLAAPGIGFVGYGFSAPEAAVRGKVVRSDRAGVTLTVTSPKWSAEIRSRLLGRFNAENLLAAAALGYALDFVPERIAAALSEAPGAPGRLARVGTDDSRFALVDYAHAPGAMEAAVSAIRELEPARLIVLFGCGGDRDRGKRPLMARAAARGDVAILTSDNPRTEDPLAIIDDAEPGLVQGGMAKGDPADVAGAGGGRLGKGVYFVEPDRAKAIALGAELLGEGDIFLVAGKGHEDYQIIGRDKRPFDDSMETLKALRDRGKST
jgi:UDP-N-acetylmuramoyl-L-alanyl-D-glutamate--2,6-diaminopimelate ligase